MEQTEIGKLTQEWLYNRRKTIQEAKQIECQALKQDCEKKIIRDKLAKLYSRKIKLDKLRDEHWGKLCGPKDDYCKTEPEFGVSYLQSENLTLTEAVNAFEKRLIKESLDIAIWNKSQASKILRTTPRILAYKMKTLGIKFTGER